MPVCAAIRVTATWASRARIGSAPSGTQIGLNGVLAVARCIALAIALALGGYLWARAGFNRNRAR